MTFNIVTFGCKVNQCETESIHAIMIKSGFKFEKNIELAEIVIINSCTVTAESDRKLRQTINKIRKINNLSVVVLMGCMPQAEPDIARQLCGVNIIIGNLNKGDIPNVIDKYLQNKTKIVDIKSINTIDKFESIPVNCQQSRSRAFLKIEDGCNRFCSYCVIPYARGKVRSKSLIDIRYDSHMLVENHFREVVLVGINLSSYGIDIGANLYDAISEVSKSGIARIRLGSLEPDLVTDELISNLKNIPNFCPQFHLSLQSGSNRILKKMRRRYTCEDYLILVKKIKNSFRYATFTTDVIVGFPGETEDDFQDTLKIINEVGFIKVHVFPYSMRAGTLASKMDNQIDKNIKSNRVKKVIEISKKIGNNTLSSFLGCKMNVLYETCDNNGFYEGYAENYIPIRVKSEKNIKGEIVETYLDNVENGFVKGFYDLF